MQPFIIIVGALSDRDKKYVVFGEKFFKCSTIIEAVDLTFKMFFALKLDYTFASWHIWSFLHVLMYNLNKDFKWRLTSKKSVGTLISDLLKVQEASLPVFTEHDY